jgi:hypothetical protein
MPDSPSEHARAMRCAMALNPAQAHTFDEPCRLLSGVTIRKKGEIAVCPQDYEFRGNIRDFSSLRQAIKELLRPGWSYDWRVNWTGLCPIKACPVTSTT